MRMHTLPITGIFLVALAAGCNGGKNAAPERTAQTEPQVTTPSVAEPPPPAAEPGEPAPAVPYQQEVIAAEPLRPEAKPEPATPPVPPKAEPSPPKVAVEKPAAIEPMPLAPAPSPAKPEAPPPPAAKPPAPTLDVAALKERLKETKAIGVFTKLALKNQVDDLLEQFQAHYQSRQKSDMAALRQAYNMLVLKVLSLIQDGDPTLAHTIAASREAIWGILADPVKFKTMM